MTETEAPTQTEAPPAQRLVIDESDGGVEWHVELDRALLLPGTLVAGRLRLQARDAVEARALVLGLEGQEHWRHRVTRTDADGHVTTEVVRSTAEPIREPVRLEDGVTLAPGEVLERPFEVPVPPLGPASLDAEDAGMAWTFEAKLDIEGGLDSRVERPVTVAQPIGLLRAGAVHLGEFALYDRVDVAAGGVTGAIQLRPVPLVCGEPFSGRLELHVPGRLRLQEIRAELRIRVEATVSEGEHQEVTAWAATVAPGGDLSGDAGFDVSGLLPSVALPSSELPHGRANATFHVILAVAWSPDTHLQRDVAIATTSEV